MGNHIDVVKELLDSGANIEAQNIDHGATPLHYAVIWNNNFDVVKELLDRGANIEAQDTHGWTALHLAAFQNLPSILPYYLDVVKQLLDRGVNKDAQDNHGQTALHWAVRSPVRENPLDVIKELVDRGANVLTKDVDGRTALDIARKYGHTDIAIERALKINRGSSVQKLE